MMNHYQDLKRFLVKILDWKNNFQKLLFQDYHLTLKVDIGQYLML